MPDILRVAVKAPDQRIIPACFELHHKIMEFLHADFLHHVCTDDPDDVRAVQAQVACRHVRDVMMLPRKLQNEIALLRDHMRLSFQDTAHGPDGKSGKFG